jgi:hypothetical protein
MTAKIHTLTTLQYSKDREGPWVLYIFGADGLHSGSQWFEREPLKYPNEEITIENARTQTAVAIDQAHEVRVCDGGDHLVFHSKDGRVLYGADFWDAIQNSNPK